MSTLGMGEDECVVLANTSIYLNTRAIFTKIVCVSVVGSGRLALGGGLR
jgi:hypothetical protein